MIIDIEKNCAEAQEIAKKSYNIINNKKKEKIYINVGSVYKFCFPTSTRSHELYNIGDTITVIGYTNLPAWGEISQSGFNWYCETKYGKSLWTTLENCISRRILVKV